MNIERLKKLADLEDEFGGFPAIGPVGDPETPYIDYDSLVAKYGCLRADRDRLAAELAVKSAECERLRGERDDARAALFVRSLESAEPLRLVVSSLAAATTSPNREWYAQQVAAALAPPAGEGVGE